MRQIDHPNIVQLIDFSESRQYYYIVLELCPGGELFHQIVRLTYFSENLSRHVIVQVAQALEYLHEVGGVVHRYLLSFHNLYSRTNCRQRYQTRESPVLPNSVYPHQKSKTQIPRRRRESRRGRIH